MRDFRKYDIWKLSHEFVLEIYTVTKDFPSQEIYGITNQVRRAAASIPTNISEGVGRSPFVVGDFGSASELVRVWYVSNGLDVALVTYVTEQPFDTKVPEEIRSAQGIVESLEF